jgi:hypothetical protein
MKLFKSFTMALLAMLALAGALSASAFALPELLGSNAWPQSVTGKNTVANPTLESTKKETLTCTALAIEGTQSNDTTGEYHFDYTGCKSSGFACHTTGDASGIILMSVGPHDVEDSEDGTNWGTGKLILSNEFTIECTALVKIKIRGHTVCLDSGALLLASTHVFSCSETGGKAAERWRNDKGEIEAAQLLLSKNGGEFIEAAWQETMSITFGEPVAYMND